MRRKLPKLLLLLIMLLALVPFGAPILEFNNLGDLNVDIAFQLALPYFLEQQFQFGEQVVFTYGPWGILLSPYTGTTWYVLALLFRIALVFCVFLALCVLADRSRGHVQRTVIWGGAIALMLLWILGHRDSYFLIPALLVAYQRWAAAVVADENVTQGRYPAEYLLWIALSLLSGWAALAKFNVFVVSTVAFLLILFEDMRQRRWPMLPGAYVVALLSAWLGAGQSLANLPLWVLRCLDLSSGYADAMAKGFLIPYDVGLVTVYYSAVVMIVLAAFAAAAFHQWKRPALLSLLFTLFVCAVSIKHGMGGNQIEQSLAVLIAVLWFVSQLLFMPSVRSAEQVGYPWRRIGLVTTIAGLVLMAMVGAKTNFPIGGPQQALADIRGNTSLLVNALRGISTDNWNATLTSARRFWTPLNVPTGQTIDVYPHYTGVVIGREGLRYSPRPAFLSLNAHTSSLAWLNARHLEGSMAPDLILFQVLAKERSVNNRHPALADGPSWPLLLSRYAPENAGNEFLLLKKRERILPMDRRLLLEVDLELGKTIRLPQGTGNLLWAEIEMKRSPAGHIVHTLYKSPHVLLESRTVENVKHVFQVVPELGNAGFLMSPLVQNNAAFAQLYSGKGSPSDIVEFITITSPEAPDVFWDKTFKLKVYALNIDLKS